MAGRKKGQKDQSAAPKRVRLVLYVPPETITQIGIASTMEKMRRADWVASAVAERARGWVVQDRRGAAAAAREDGPVAEPVRLKMSGS